MTTLKKRNVFVSFDYDHDARLKDAIIGQSKYPNSPFGIIDFSMKEAAPQRQWREDARNRIASCSVMLVLCGTHTNSARGVSDEIKIARELGKPYFLIRGYPDKRCRRPRAAPRHKMYPWKWEILKELINNPRAVKNDRSTPSRPARHKSKRVWNAKRAKSRRRNGRGRNAR